MPRKLTATERQNLNYFMGDITQASQQYQVPWDVLASVGLQESGLNPNAPPNHDSNGTEDLGVMQLNNAYYNPAIADNPSQAIYTAAHTLAQNYRNCGSWAGAVQAYNLGHCGSDPAYLAGVQQYQQALAAEPNVFGNATATDLGPQQPPANGTSGGGFFAWLHQYSWVLLIPGAAFVWLGVKKIVG